MSLLAKSKGEVTYKDLTSLHKWALVVLISMGSSIIYAPMYLKNVFYDPLMQALGCTNADLGLMVSAYGIAAMICYLPSGIVADKFRMRTLATVGFLATAVLVGIYAMLPSVEICLVLFVAMGITSILVWWGTRFKVIRLCCEEDEYASKIGISYSIYGVTGLVIGLINAGIIAAIANVAQGVQVMLIFLAVVIAVLGVASIFLIPDFKGEIDKNAKLFSLKEAVEAIKHPGVIWACVAYFCVYAVYQGATYTTPYLTQCFNADGNLVNVVGLIRTYGIGLIAGPMVGFIATKIKSPSRDHPGRLHPVHRGARRLHPVPAGSLRGHGRRHPGRRVRVHHLRRLLHRKLSALGDQDPHAHLRHGRRRAVRGRLHARRVHPHLVRRPHRRPGHRCLHEHLRFRDHVRRHRLHLPRHVAPHHQEALRRRVRR
ncbi:MAG: MFS transporter [Adlercreutzia sp.]